jgi:thioredoxin reductase (NADPH)
VVDDGDSRLKWIPKTRNMIGFPDGVVGRELHERLQQHVDQYGVTRLAGRIGKLEHCEDGTFQADCAGRRLRARTVLLATGARDVEPDVPGLAEGLQCGQVRYCPVCDGYETRGQRVAVLGREIHGLREALFISGFDNQVTWLSMGSQEAIAPGDLARLREAGVRMADQAPRHVVCRPGRDVVVDLLEGPTLYFDVLYPALGLVHASELATALGAGVEKDGQLIVDAHQQTTVPGLYAAGDVAAGLNQISVAAGHAAIAATAIHNSL